MANIWWIRQKAREFQKNPQKPKNQKNDLCFINYTKAFDCVDHNKPWKAIKELGIPDHLTCLLRNLYEGQEATIRTLYGTTDWFKVEKGVWQDCLLSCCLFNLYTEHIMGNVRLYELQAGIRGRDINNLRYADDTALMAESEEEPKNLLMRVKEESERAGLKLKLRSWPPAPLRHGK